MKGYHGVSHISLSEIWANFIQKFSSKKYWYL